MSQAVRGFVIPSGQGVQLRGPTGGPVHIKARGDVTDGRFAALEIVIGPQQGPPLHRHRHEDELYYVLDGRLRVDVDGERLDASAGAFVFIPRGAAHRFQNVGDQPARLLVIFAPAGMERFFEDQARLPAIDFASDAYRAVAQSAGMELLGPPMAAADGER